MRELKNFRVFISSPGDVADERMFARKFFKEILSVDPWLRGKATFDVFSWDDPEAHVPMPAHLTPQEAINKGLCKPSECDIVIVILWSRMGTPLPETYKKRDGSNYLSGTEYEYLDALDSANTESRPTILIYRRTAIPSIPINLSIEKRKEAENQWRHVEDFFEKFRSPDGSLKTGVHLYADLEEFSALLRQHMHASLSGKLSELTTVAPNSDIFVVPNFGQSVSRPSLLQPMSDACLKSSVFCVTGISGSGKTYLTTQLVEKLLSTGTFTKVLWYEAEKGEPLDGLLSKLHGLVGLSSPSTQSQAKELMGFLVKESSVLVIDDYQQADRDSYEPLFRYAASKRPPAKLILISKLYPDELAEFPSANMFQVYAFSAEEASLLLSTREIFFAGQLQEALLQKTGAHPLAITLFCTLVKTFKYDPAQLLAGEWSAITRLKRWFDELNSFVSEDARRLLDLIALTEGPFDTNVAEVLCAEIIDGKSDHSNIRRVASSLFDELARAFLIESYGANRWRVHDLVASMCYGRIEKAVVDVAHMALGDYFIRLSGGWELRAQDDTTLQLKIRACKHYAKTPLGLQNVYRVLPLIAPEIKRRGHYRQYIDLAKPFIGCNNANYALWIDYDFAHCCLILGYTSDCLDVIERLTHSGMTESPSLSLSACRLYAEALHANGNTSDAEQVLTDALRVASEQGLRGLPVLHAESILIGIETFLGQLDRAKARAKAILRKNTTARSQAVVHTRMGAIELIRQNYASAKKELELAADLFAKTGDVRGQAWVSSHMCELFYDMGHITEALDELKISADIYGQIENYDREYRLLLLRLRDKDQAGELEPLLKTELSRLESLRSKSVRGISNSPG